MHMVRIYKYMDVKLIKYRFRKILINILTKLFIQISEIILHLNLLIIRINGQNLTSKGSVNCSSISSLNYSYFLLKSYFILTFS